MPGPRSRYSVQPMTKRPEYPPGWMTRIDQASGRTWLLRREARWVHHVAVDRVADPVALAWEIFTQEEPELAALLSSLPDPEFRSRLAVLCSRLENLLAASPGEPEALGILVITDSPRFVCGRFDLSLVSDLRALAGPDPRPQSEQEADRLGAIAKARGPASENLS